MAVDLGTLIRDRAHVPCKDIAEYLGLSGNAGTRRVNRCAKKLGIEIPSIGGKCSLRRISSEDVPRLVEELESLLSLVPKPRKDPTSSGVYIIEFGLGEDYPPRIKIGWADDFSKRISSHRVLLPNLKVHALFHTGDKQAEWLALKIAENHAQKIGTSETYLAADPAKVVEVIASQLAHLGIPMRLIGGCDE